MPGHVRVSGVLEGHVGSQRDERAAPVRRRNAQVTASVDPAAAADAGMALRVPAFGVVSVALGIGAHMAGGGEPPTVAPLLLIALIVVLAGHTVALKEQSLARLIGFVWTMQAAVHFILMSQHGGMASHLSFLRMGGHHGHLTAGLSAPPPADVVAGSTMPGMEGLTPGMLLAHGLAGLVVAAWLRRGEAAVWRAARRILPRLLPNRPTTPRQSVTRTAPVTWPPRVRLAGVLLLLTDPRRGPPAPAI